MQQFLPLAHHAHPLVVDDHDLDRQAVLNRRRQLLNVHQDRRLTSHVDAAGAGVTDLHADGSRETVAHGPQPAGGHPAVGLFKAEVLRRPHLMLADFGGNQDIITVLGQLLQAPERVLGTDLRLALLLRETEAIDTAPLVDLFPPAVEFTGVNVQRLRAPQPDHVFEHVSGIADDRNIDHDVLVDRRGVDINVDLGRIRRELVELAGDAVIEARTDVEHHVTVVHGQIGFVGAVHAQHPNELLIRSRVSPQPHQGVGNRHAGHPGELDQQLRGFWACVDDPAPSVDDRTLGLGQRLNSLLNLSEIALEPRLVGSTADVRLLLVDVSLVHQHVFGQVDDNGAGTAGRRDQKGLVNNAGDVFNLLHQIVVLGTGAGDAGGIGFLEGVLSDQMGRHLPGQADNRNRVHERVGQARDSVGRTGAGGHQHTAHFTGRAGIALGRVDRRLLVAHEDVPDRILLKQGIVNRQDCAAGIAEDDFNSLLDQGCDQRFCTGFRITHGWFRICREYLGGGYGPKGADPMPKAKQTARTGSTGLANN